MLGMNWLMQCLPEKLNSTINQTPFFQNFPTPTRDHYVICLVLSFLRINNKPESVMNEKIRIGLLDISIHTDANDVVIYLIIQYPCFNEKKHCFKFSAVEKGCLINNDSGVQKPLIKHN